jgi:hypothetical protein
MTLKPVRHRVFSVVVLVRLGRQYGLRIASHVIFLAAMTNLASFALLVAVLLLSIASPVLGSVAPPPVPEPGTVLLIGGGIGALVLYHRKRQSKK